MHDASGPDESGASSRSGTDPAYVSVVAKLAIRHTLNLNASAANGTLPQGALPLPNTFTADDLREVGEGLRLLTEDMPTSTGKSGKYHLEFAGWVYGSHYKQADVTMINFPFQFGMDKSTLANDLVAYPGGFQQMSAMPTIIGFLDVSANAGASTAAGTAAKSLADQYFHNLTTQCMEGPFNMWMEKTNFSKDGVRHATNGAPNYYTTHGGWLQSVTAGYAGIRVNNSRLEIHHATVLPQTTGLAVMGVQFRGFTLDFEITVTSAVFHSQAAAGNLKLTMHTPSGDQRPGSTSALRISPVDGAHFILKPDEAVFLQTNGVIFIEGV
jgi:hypothetical protein